MASAARSLRQPPERHRNEFDEGRNAPPAALHAVVYGRLPAGSKGEEVLRSDAASIPGREPRLAGAVADGLTQAPPGWWRRESAQPDVVATDSAAETGSVTAFRAVLAFTVILLLSPQFWIPGLATLRIALLAAAAAIGAVLWDRVRGVGSPTRDRELLIAGVLLAWAIVTIPLSLWPGGSVSVLTDRFMKSLAVLWLLPNVVTSLRRLRILSVTLVACCGVLALSAVGNYVTGTLAGGGPVARIAGYRSPLASNPNDMALLLNLLLPLVIATFLISESRKVRLFAIAVGVAAAAGVIATFSRAGFLGLATVVGIYAVKLITRPGRERSFAFALIVAGVLALPFLPGEYVARLTTITAVEADPTGSAQERKRDTFAALAFVAEHPIVGAGLGSDSLALNAVRGARWLSVHNAYLQYAVDLGIPGLLLFLALLWSSWRAAASSARNARNRRGAESSAALAEALSISVGVFAVGAFFHPVAYHFYFYYFAGLALATRRVVPPETARP